MDEATRTTFNNLWSRDGDARYQDLLDILEATDEPVDWAYEVWDDLVQKLSDKDNHYRAIASQVLCNLAKSDPHSRMLEDFITLLAVTSDKRFVTARHCLQAIWKVGAAGDRQRKMVVDGLADRFEECIEEKNCTLIRYDIVQGLKKLYEESGDDGVKEKALQLISTEDDAKYRAKYSGVWRVR